MSWQTGGFWSDSIPVLTTNFWLEVWRKGGFSRYVSRKPIKKPQNNWNWVSDGFYFFDLFVPNWSNWRKSVSKKLKFVDMSKTHSKFGFSNFLRIKKIRKLLDRNRILLCDRLEFFCKAVQTLGKVEPYIWNDLINSMTVLVKVLRFSSISKFL